MPPQIVAAVGPKISMLIIILDVALLFLNSQILFHLMFHHNMLDSLKRLNFSTTGSIVVMPDFFVDRIIKLKSKEELINLLTEKARFGGGSISGIATIDTKGGNAVNVAYCLAKLGMNVKLFTIADDIGSAILKRIFSKFGDRASLYISNGKHGLTTALEFPGQTGSKVNVMLGDLGNNEDFGPERIYSEEYLKILANADAVIVVNWATNLKGTELAEYAFRNSPKALHFLDPADIETRKEEFRDSIKEITELIDVLSINENECNSLAKAIGFDLLIPEDNYNEENVKNAAKVIANKTGIKNVDLHTRIGSAWSDGNEWIFSPSFKCEVKTMTGAGDSWDSADIVGYIAGLGVKERLTFSNAYASLYISNPASEPETMNQLSQFVENL
jgi:ribokinase